MNVAAFGTTTDDNESYCIPGWNGDFEVYRMGAALPAPDFKLAGSTTPSQVFGGPHSGGFQTVWCDGSVRSVRYLVALANWTRACVRNDGQVLDLSDL